MKYLLAIFILLPALSVAELKQYQDWQLYRSEKEAVTANTISKSGKSLGITCIPSKSGCMYTFSSDSSCNERSSQVVLLNTNSGATLTNIECNESKSDGKPYYLNIFLDYKIINAFISSEFNQIGISIPLIDGSFEVLTFSLKGANDAVTSMIKLVDPEK